MPIKIEKLQPGMVVYDVHSERMGNTTAKTVGVWRVQIKEANGYDYIRTVKHVQ